MVFARKVWNSDRLYITLFAKSAERKKKKLNWNNNTNYTKMSTQNTRAAVNSEMFIDPEKFVDKKRVIDPISCPGSRDSKQYIQLTALH